MAENGQNVGAERYKDPESELTFTLEELQQHEVKEQKRQRHEAAVRAFAKKKQKETEDRRAQLLMELNLLQAPAPPIVVPNAAASANAGDAQIPAPQSFLSGLMQAPPPPLVKDEKGFVSFAHSGMPGLEDTLQSPITVMEGKKVNRKVDSRLYYLTQLSLEADVYVCIHQG